MCVTLYPSWWPAAPVRPFSAARERSQAAGLWPGHETPRRGSRRAHSPPLDLGTTLHFSLTRDLQPGGVGEKKTAAVTSYGNNCVVSEIKSLPFLFSCIIVNVTHHKTVKETE